jgi:hypothetical protein
VITHVAKVVVPVEDQQAALEFWTTTMGFTAVRSRTLVMTCPRRASSGPAMAA